MYWQHLGLFWGYGDRNPQLVVLTDSILTVKGPQGRGDATPVVQWILSMHVCPTVVLAYPGARVMRGDYLEMVNACANLGCATTLIVSMGNDLYGGVKATAIADGLKQILATIPNGHVIFGGSASVWGYQDGTYDAEVKEVCNLLGCPNGATELANVKTVDAIGHLHVKAVPQLCKAFVQWCSSVRNVSRSRL